MSFATGSRTAAVLLDVLGSHGHRAGYALATSVVMSGRQSLALGADPTSPLSPDRRPGLLISGKGGVPPLPGPWVTPRLRHRADTRCEQRSRAAHPTPGAARQRQGKQHHRFMFVRRSGFFSQLARRRSALPMHLVTARCRIVLTSHSHQRGHAPPASRFALFPGHITTFASSSVWVAGQCARRCCTPRRRPQSVMVSASQCGSQSAMVLGVATARLRIVAGRRIFVPGGIHSFGHTLRFYIRPHCVKCPPVSRAAPLVPAIASRPAGLRSRHYAKWPTLVRTCQPPALPSRCASDVQSPAALVLCWRRGFSQALRALFWSVACGHVSCVCPAHPRASPRCA